MKTGTSEPYETVGLVGETWDYGYTPQLVFGSWFGNADNTPMDSALRSYYVSVNTVKDFMVAYHENLPVEEFTRPDGIASASLCVPSLLRAGAGCPIKTPNDLWATRSLPSKDDDWWQVTRIDRRTGKPATPTTPSRFVVEQRTIRVPNDVPEFIREQALEWGKAQNPQNTTPTPDNGDDDDNGENFLALALTSPAEASPISGIVSIGGSASSSDFQSYRLEFRSESQPGDWLLISQSSNPIEEGVLGRWNTFALQPGLYTVRLILVDERQGEVSTQLQLLVVDETIVTPVPDNGQGGGNQGRGRGRGGDDD
jgi:hypothetical protein